MCSVALHGWDGSSEPTGLIAKAQCVKVSCARREIRVAGKRSALA
jgi:hypothetical protein